MIINFLPQLMAIVVCSLIWECTLIASIANNMDPETYLCLYVFCSMERPTKVPDVVFEQITYTAF